MITINSRKFDGKIHRTWQCEMLAETADYWLFVGTFEAVVNHAQLGLIRRGTISYEYYWKNEWFNVFRFHEPEGDLKFFYCNLNLPPRFQDSVLDYIDLDIDILVEKDLSYRILDEDEFEVNSRLFKYPVEVLEQVQKSRSNLIEKIKKRDFPFDCKSSQTL